MDSVTIASKGSNAQIRLSGQDKLADGSKVYSFTGKEIVPTFEYDLNTGEYLADEDWKALPASSYRLTFKKDGKTVDSMVEAGTYTVILSDSSKDDNYVVDHTFTNVTVHAYASFGDVKPGEWYAKPVYQAKELGYINGLRNADLFAPTKTITRATSPASCSTWPAAITSTRAIRTSSAASIPVSTTSIRTSTTQRLSSGPSPWA